MGWPIAILCVLLAVIFYTRMTARAEREAAAPDAGTAILDFGRAFPDEAIRSIHGTRDGRAFFVRLHDGKAGFMESHGAHYACQLIEAGKVRVTEPGDGARLKVEFVDFPALSRVYEFPSAQEAADVALWLLGSFSPKSEFTAPPEA